VTIGAVPDPPEDLHIPVTIFTRVGEGGIPGKEYRWTWTAPSGATDGTIWWPEFYFDWWGEEVGTYTIQAEVRFQDPDNPNYATTERTYEIIDSWP
jgi:hypothetical protein